MSKLVRVVLIGSFFLVVFGMICLTDLGRCAGGRTAQQTQLQPIIARDQIPAPRLDQASPLKRNKFGVTQRGFEATQGNFSYIRLDISRYVSDVDNTPDPIALDYAEVLGALDHFEKSHPDLDILDFQVQYKELDFHVARIGGIWIHHRRHR